MPEDFSPSEKFERYNKKHPKKDVRSDMADDGKIQDQKKTSEILNQELISHKQNYDSNLEGKAAEEYFKKLGELRAKVNKARRLERNG